MLYYTIILDIFPLISWSDIVNIKEMTDAENYRSV